MTPAGPQISVIRGMSCLIIVSPRGAAPFLSRVPRRRAACNARGALPWRVPGGRTMSGHPLVRGQRKELGVVVGQRHLGEQGGGLVVPGGVEGPAEGRGDLPPLLADDL